MPSIQVEGHIPADQEPVTAPQGDEVISLIRSDPRTDRPVIESGPDLHLEIRLSPHSLYDAQNLSVRMMLSSSAHGEAIANANFAAGCSESGLQNQALFHIATRDLGAILG